MKQLKRWGGSRHGHRNTARGQKAVFSGLKTAASISTRTTYTPIRLTTFASVSRQKQNAPASPVRAHKTPPTWLNKNVQGMQALVMPRLAARRNGEMNAQMHP